MARTKDGIGRIGADLHLTDIDIQLVNRFSPLLDNLEIDPAIKSSIERFSGSAENDHRAFELSLPYFVLFHGMYMRAVTQGHQEVDMKIFSRVNEKTYKTGLSQDSESDEIIAREPEFNVENGEDRYGHIPKWGPPTFRQMWKEFCNFVRENKPEGTTLSDYRRELKDNNIGLFQCWGFWRYFTSQPILVKEMISDFNESWARRDNEYFLTNDLMLAFDENEKNHFDFLVANSDGEGNLSKPRRSAACNYTLGCVQNLPKESVPKANMLSFEHEHSRPHYYGGKDGTDSCAMCWLHNKLKHENPLFDTDTILNIVTFGDYNP